MKFTDRQREAVLRLRVNTDFQDFCEALKTYEDECTDAAIFVTDEEKSGPMRGMARSLKIIRKALTEIYEGN